MKALILPGLAILLSGCGKAPQYDYVNRTVMDPLIGLPSDEIIKKKYDGPPTLICDVRVQEGDVMNLMIAPVETMTWTIDELTTLKKFLNYSLGSKSYLVAFRMEDPIEFVDEVSIMRNGHEFQMQNSPVLKLYYRRGLRSMLSNGSVHDLRTYTKITLNENVTTPLFTLTTETLKRELITEDVRCTLKTKLRAQYRDQWKIIR